MLETSPLPEHRQDTRPSKLPEEIFRDGTGEPEATAIEETSEVAAETNSADVEEHAGEEGPTEDDSSDEEPAEEDPEVNRATPDVVTPVKKIGTKGLIAVGVAVATGVTAVVAGVAGAFGGNKTPAVPQPLPSASAPVTPGPSTAENTPSSSLAPTESSQPSSTSEPSETATSKPSASETAQVKELPSVEAFRKMSPEQRLQAIEDSLPESLLSNPEAVYTRTLKLEELIYNAPASDEEYKKYVDGGGLDYVGYIMDNYYNPLFKKLLGKEPSTKLEDEGALTFAYRAANVLDMRYQDKKYQYPTIMTPYNITIEVVSTEKPVRDQAPYDIHGTISMYDTIDETQAEALANLKDFHVNVLDPNSTVEFSMISVHYDRNAGMIRASQLR